MQWILYTCECGQDFSLPAIDDLDSSEVFCPQCGHMETSERTTMRFDVDRSVVTRNDDR